MEEGIEIYLRPGGRTDRHLMFHIPEHLRERFIQAVLNGHVDGAEIPMHVELSVLQEWLTGPEQTASKPKLKLPLHMRVRLTGMYLDTTANG